VYTPTRVHRSPYSNHKCRYVRMRIARCSLECNADDLVRAAVLEQAKPQRAVTRYPSLPGTYHAQRKHDAHDVLTHARPCVDHRHRSCSETRSGAASIIRVPTRAVCRRTHTGPSAVTMLIPKIAPRRWPWPVADHPLALAVCRRARGRRRRHRRRHRHRSGTRCLAAGQRDYFP